MINKKITKSFSPDTTNVDLPDVTNEGLYKYAGKHIIADFYGVEQLDNIELMEQALTQASEIAGATLLHIHLHTFSDGGGITGVALLAESHISVHTWPELKYAAFDAFMCGDAKPEKAIELLKDVFRPDRVEIKDILRG